MDSKYPFAFGFLESAVHRALRELDRDRCMYAHSHDGQDGPCQESTFEARNILLGALLALQRDHGIELHWPDDVKEHGDGTL